MTSFLDIYEADIDYDAGTLTIIRNSGKVNQYNIEDEQELVNNLIDKKSEVTVNIIEKREDAYREEVAWEKAFRKEYKEKYGEDFDEWRW